jgi:Tfp pilus assembly PilM family ATPase/Tfp pilus assembly protein PilN
MIGLEFNEKYVKAVELKETSQGLTLTKFNISPVQLKTPEQTPEAAIAETIEKVLTGSRILENEVYIAVSGPLVQIRRISLPPMPEAELRDAVKWEARNFATFPIEAALIDFQMLEKASTAQKNNLLIVAVEKAMLNKQLAILTEAELKCVGVTIPAFALGSVLRRLPTLPKTEAVALLDFGPELVTLTIFKENLPRFTREIRLPEPLTAEVQSSFTYYREQFFEEKVSRIYLSGESSQLPELKDSLTQELGVPTEILDPTLNLIPGPNLDQVKLRAEAPRLALVIGLAENRAKDMNFLAKKEKPPRTELGKLVMSLSIPNTAVIAALLVIVTLLFGFNYYLSRVIEGTKTELNLKNLRLTQLTKYQERKNAYEEVKAEQVEVKKLVGQIASLLPAEVLLASLNFDQQKQLINLAGESSAPQLISKFLKELDQQANFSEVKLIEIKKVGKVTTFNISFKLVI